MRQKVISAILILVLAGFAAGLVFLMKALKGEPGERDKAAPALLVRTLKLAETDYKRMVVAYGTVAANRTVVVSSEVSGEVVAVHDALRPGNIVGPSLEKALVRIDDEVLREQFAAAQARLDQAAAQLEQIDREQKNLEKLLALSRKDLDVALKEERRLRQLALQDHAVPESAHDQAKLALQRYESARQILLNRRSLLPSRRKALDAVRRLARSQLNLARRALTKTRIGAPFRGVVVERRVEAGQRVTGGGMAPGTPLFVLMDAETIEVPLQVPASQLAKLREGQHATLMSEAFADAGIERRWTAAVARIGGQVDPVNRTVAVYLRGKAEQNGLRLRPGMFVRGTIEVDAAPRRAILIPRYVVQDGAVFVAENGKARRRELNVAEVLPEQLVLEPNDSANGAGLRPGDLVIASNLEMIYDGVAVQPAEE